MAQKYSKLSTYASKTCPLISIGILILPLQASAFEFGCLGSGGESKSFIVQGRPTVVDGDTLKVGPFTIDLFGIGAPPLGTLCKSAKGEEFDCGVVAKDHLESIVQEGGPVSSCLIEIGEVLNTGSGVCGQFDANYCISVDFGGRMTSDGFAHAGPVGEMPTSNLYWQGHLARTQKRGLYAGEFPDFKW